MRSAGVGESGLALAILVGLDRVGQPESKQSPQATRGKKKKCRAALTPKDPFAQMKRRLQNYGFFIIVGSSSVFLPLLIVRKTVQVYSRAPVLHMLANPARSWPAEQEKYNKKRKSDSAPLPPKCCCCTIIRVPEYRQKNTTRLFSLF